MIFELIKYFICSLANDRHRMFHSDCTCMYAQLSMTITAAFPQQFSRPFPGKRRTRVQLDRKQSLAHTFVFAVKCFLLLWNSRMSWQECVCVCVLCMQTHRGHRSEMVIIMFVFFRCSYNLAHRHCAEPRTESEICNSSDPHSRPPPDPCVNRPARDFYECLCDIGARARLRERDH